jgi:predicted nucleotidyltransferase
MIPMEETEEIVDALRRAGARFGFVFGSRAEGRSRPDSDMDIAAYWGSDAPDPWRVPLPGNVDLLVLDTAPLELAGRVALRGRLLFDDDPETRVGWQAQKRLEYLDEEWLQVELDRSFVESRHGR